MIDHEHAGSAASLFAMTRPRPCLYHGAALDWPAVGAWRDLDASTREAGNEPITFCCHHDALFRWDVHAGPVYTESELTLSDALSSAPNGEFRFAQAIPLETLPALAGKCPAPPSQDRFARTFWMGTGGHITPLHYDLTSNVLVVLRGRKTVHLLDPSICEDIRHCALDAASPNAFYSLLPDGRVLGLAGVEAVELTPGDGLFIPAGWWHRVASHGVNVAVSHWRIDEHAAGLGHLRSVLGEVARACRRLPPRQLAVVGTMLTALDRQIVSDRQSGDVASKGPAC